MSGKWAVSLFTLGLVACTTKGTDTTDDRQTVPLVTAPASEAAVPAPVQRAESPPPPPPGCSDPDPLLELFRPTLTPISPMKINPRNSATRVHRARDRIVRIEVAHAYTHRHLFDFDAVGLAAMREIPDYPPLRLRARDRPNGGPNWPVVLLIYLENEDLPYLGHMLSTELYFTEDEWPWTISIMADDGKHFRPIFPMPVSSGVYGVLRAKFGYADPDGKRWSEAWIKENHRCGRESAAPREERPSAFPGIPRAVIGHTE